MKNYLVTYSKNEEEIKSLLLKATDHKSIKILARNYKKNNFKGISLIKTTIKYITFDKIIKGLY
jgi:hypothetical protein